MQTTELRYTRELERHMHPFTVIGAMSSVNGHIADKRMYAKLGKGL